MSARESVEARVAREEADVRREIRKTATVDAARRALDEFRNDQPDGVDYTDWCMRHVGGLAVCVEMLIEVIDPDGGTNPNAPGGHPGASCSDERRGGQSAGPAESPQTIS